jgi:predicted O-linked N-acetylglucosamine transferase (SPINDLY family)
LIGMPELAARTEDEFVAAAVGLANHRARLRRLRARLRGTMQRSPLMDGQRFARNLEAVYRAVWQTWCGAAREGGG